MGGAVVIEVVLIVLVVLLVAVGALAAASVRVLREYERGVVFRLGRVIDLKGPGVALLVPGADRLVKVSLRTVTLRIPPQEVITRDNVPVRVAAVAYFRVIDPNRSVLEIEDFRAATLQIAQTTLRSVLGKAELDALLAERERLNESLQQIIDEQTEPWGIKVTIVEIKDVEIPDSMQHALARQAEAERNRRAKVINAEGEHQAADRLAQAADVIRPNPVTLQLRYLQALQDVSANPGSTIVFPLPLDLLRPLLESGDGPGATAPASPALRDSREHASRGGRTRRVDRVRARGPRAPARRDRARLGAVGGARRGRGGGRRPARQARGRGHAVHGARRRRARPPRGGRAGAARAARGGGLPARAAAARLRARGRRRRAHDHRDRQPARPGGARPAALGRARGNRRRSTSPPATSRRVRAARAAKMLVSTTARARHAARGGRAAGRAGRERARPGRALRVRRARPAAALRDPHRRAATAASTRPPTGGAARGRRRPCPDRSATSTAAATASPPASPTGSAPACEIEQALDLGARCGAACATGRGPYAGQLREA